MTSTRQMRSDASRNHEAILTGAIAVLASVPNATMREIADASGIGRTTLYRHFPDREALVAAIYDRVHAEANDAITRALDSVDADTDPPALVAQIAAEIADFGDRYRFLDSHAGASLARDSTPLTDGGRRLLRWIVDRQNDGEIRRDLDAGWMVEVTRAIITRAANHRDEDPEARAQTVTRTVTSLLAPPPAEASATGAMRPSARG